MKLTKSQKKFRDQQIEEAKAVTDASAAVELWERKYPKPQISEWVRYYLLKNPNVWEAIRPLLRASARITEAEHALLENPALSDNDLFEFDVVDQRPLHTLRHPGCGDLCLSHIAALWEKNEGANIDCVPSWASKDQIERMFELRPSCKDNNATLEYNHFLCSHTPAELLHMSKLDMNKQG